MDLGKKIYELRKHNNITQEQLANAIGVSTPAVCKWETGVSLPDITLLAPLARKLNTSLDDLLSFNKDLSKTEVDEIVKEIKNTARTGGLNAAIDLTDQYLKQFPNSDGLKLSAAMLPVMMAHTADEEYMNNDEKFQKLLDRSIPLLEELTHSEDDLIRYSAVISLGTRYMEHKRFDEAEAMLKKLPGQDFDVRHMFPSLYIMKEEYEKAFESSQANMVQDIQHLLVDIKVQHTIYLKSKEYDKALRCAKDYLSIIEITGFSLMSGNDLLVNTYLAMGQIENASECFLKYIDEIINIRKNSLDAFYYSTVSGKLKIASPDVEDDIRTGLYKYVLLDDRYKALRESAKVKAKLDELKHILKLDI